MIPWRKNTVREISDIINKIKEYNPSADTEIIERAYLFAKNAHQHQNRLSGEAYISHPLEIAYILAELHMDTATIVAGLLHDVIEDTEYTFQDIAELFSEEIAELVDGVTKIAKLEYSNTEEAQLDSFRKMFVAMANDIRVIIIKLTDRLHNMRTLEYMTLEKQRQKAQEVLDIYAPISHRLGIFMMKMEFEDLALRFIDPEVYDELIEMIAQKRSEREKYVENLITLLKNKLEIENIPCEITGRPKHFYSIYKKMESGKNFDEIYDLIAIRVLVETDSDCYAVLGWVHELWKPIPGRIKDYIAMPKPNMYQSLHATVIGPGGTPFEIQIRTKEMHKTAEYGIAAHWKYKEGGKHNDELSNLLQWLLELKEMEPDISSSDDFMESVKNDLYPDDVYVFTPKGKVIELKNGSTPIDFAYRIHSDIGDKCVGARINNKLVPLNYILTTGDIVEILTNPNSKGPSRDWLNIVASSAAKSKIRSFFRKTEKEENIAKGQVALEKEILNQNLEISQIINNKYSDFVYKRFSVQSWEDLYAIIGYGGIRPQFVVMRIKDNFKTDFPEEETTPTIVSPPKGNKGKNVQIQGHQDLVLKFAKCCTPVPGDTIMGYITKGRGITIHRSDCINITNVVETERLINADWVDEETEGKFAAELFIKAIDRQRLLSDVSTIIGNEGISISGISLRTLKDSSVQISIDIIVTSTDQVENLVRKISNIQNIISVYRV